MSTSHLPLTPQEAGRKLLESRRVVVAAFGSSLGEILAVTPLLRNLRLAIPEAAIVFLTGPRHAGAVLDHPELASVEVYPPPGLLVPLRRAQLVARLRSDPVDVVLCPCFAPPPARARALIKALSPGVIAGLEEAGAAAEGRFFDCTIPLPEDPRTHVVDSHLFLLEGLGIPVVSREHFLAVTPEQRSRADRLLEEAGLDPSRPILGAQVGGTPRRTERQWPPSHYATVLQRAVRELEYQVVLLGSRADTPTLDAVQALGKAPIPRLVDLEFPDYKAVLSRLRVFITHDGDPVHVAAAVGVRSFFIFLSTPAWRWAPYGAHVSVWEESGRAPGPAEAWSKIRPLLVDGVRA